MIIISNHYFKERRDFYTIIEQLHTTHSFAFDVMIAITM
jgi:hypothetical protein